MTLSVGQVQALTVKGIEAKGGVRDAVFKNHSYLKRLREKQGVYSGEKMSFPFMYQDDEDSTGSWYEGAETLSLDMYDPFTELSFDLKELQESLVITHRDLARNSGKEARIKLVDARLSHMEMAMRQRFTRGIYGDGTNTKEVLGVQTFLKSSSVNYGGVTDTDVSVHVATVLSNSGTARALSTALDQAALGGASEGEEKPTLRIMPQLVMNQFIELLKPHQRTTRESSLNGLGHEGNTLVYSGVDSIVDNLAPAGSIIYLNEKHVKLWSHPDYDMKRVQKGDLETMDAMLQRLFWKGIYVCDVLRYQAWLKDIATA
jgi:hypothetical protein